LRAAEGFPEPGGAGAQGNHFVGVEQIDVYAVREAFAQQSGFTRLAGAPEECGLAWRQVQDEFAVNTHRRLIPD